MENKVNNKITGKDVYTKFQELMPNEMLKKITPEILNDTCNHPSTQPFLKWFCEYVGDDNILTREEMTLRENLKKRGQWYDISTVKDKLADALKDKVELISMIESNRNYEEELKKSFELEKEAYEADLNFIQSFEEELRYLKEIDADLREELENEKASLDKMTVKVNKSYIDCYENNEKLDSAHRELYVMLQNQLKIYSDAAQMKGPLITWTQMPLDVFSNQMEIFYKYFQYKLQRVCNNESECEVIDNDKIQECTEVQFDIISTTLDKIDTEIEKSRVEIICTTFADLYHNKNSRMPHFDVYRNIEVTQSLSQKENLEENILILESQLKECIMRFAKISLIKVAIELRETRFEQKQARLKKLEYYANLCRDKGHSAGDLLVLLMQHELANLKKIIDFASYAFPYFHMEYPLSTKRTGIMKELQAEYDSIAKAPACDRNVYNKLFKDLIIKSNNSPDAFDAALMEYDKILLENKKFQEERVKIDIENIIHQLKSRKDRMMITYNKELNSGATKSLRYMSDDLARQFELTNKMLEDIKSSFSDNRKKFKYLMEKIDKDSMGREKQILWQKFLASPEDLKSRYDELQNKVERLHFVSSLQNE